MSGPLTGVVVAAVIREPADATALASQTVHDCGATSFTFGWAHPDGTSYEGKAKPAPEDDVLWWTEAVVRRKVRGHRPTDTTYRGEALVRAGASHGVGTVYACVDLLETMGATVNVDDRTPTTPQETP